MTQQDGTKGSGDITITATVGSGSSTILFDTSAHKIVFQDNLRAKFGTGGDLSIYHDGSNGLYSVTCTADHI